MRKLQIFRDGQLINSILVEYNKFESTIQEYTAQGYTCSEFVQEIVIDENPQPTVITEINNEYIMSKLNIGEEIIWNSNNEKLRYIRSKFNSSVNLLTANTYLSFLVGENLITDEMRIKILP